MLTSLTNQLKQTTDPKERDELCIKIYDIRSGGRKRVPDKLKIKEINTLIEQGVIYS